MKRKLLCITMVIVMLISSLGVMNVTALTSGDYEYEKHTDDNVIITKYTGTEEKRLVIPSQIDGCKVTAIDDYAFENLTAEEIVLPDTVEYIGSLAFFNMCAESIHIPESVVSLGVASFAGADFAEFTVDEDNEVFKAIDGVLYTKDGRVLVSYPCGKSDTEYKISDGVEAVYNGAFYCAYILEEITMPEGLLYIYPDAFANYKKLNEVVLPETLRRIGPCAFENCPKLKEITIPASVDEIYPFALGYTYVEGESEGEGEHFPVEGFVIKGYANSVAEVYALENGFEFVAIGELDVSELLGDTDIDGSVMIKDATAIQKYLAGLKLFASQQKINADMNSDGEVNIKDATAIQKHLVGLEY